MPPPLAACVLSETSSYRVSTGILGTIAELTLQIVPESLPSEHATPFPSLLRAVAQGGGSVFGLGRSEQRIWSEFDARRLTARRWKNVWSNGNGVTTDTGEQSQPGTLALLHKRSNEADRAESFTRMLPIVGPVGFLLHLRVALPTKPNTYQVLNGRALWLVSASAARTGSETQDLWRVDGKLEPIFWDGRPDCERTRYAFSSAVRSTVVVSNALASGAFSPHSRKRAHARGCSGCWSPGPRDLADRAGSRRRSGWCLRDLGSCTDPIPSR